VKTAAAPSRRVRLGILLALPCGLLLVGVVAPSPRADAGAPAAVVEPAAKAEVRSVLDGMRGTWVVDAQPSLPVADDRDRDRYEQPLAEFLSPRDPLLRQAVQLAVQQRQVDLVPQLRRLLAHAQESDRQLLVEAIEQLQPWSDDELQDLLRSQSPGTAIGALRIAGLRERPPLEAIVDRLADAAAEVRAAALDALPAELPATAAAIVLSAEHGAAADQRGELLAALARCPAAADVDEVLYAPVELHTDQCENVLAALAARGAPLSRPDAVRRLALDESAPPRLRGRALRCLEACAAVAGAEAFEQARLRDPLLLYAVARLLLTAHRPAGVDLLLELLRLADETVEAAEETDARFAQEAQLGARQILAAFADTSVTAEVDEWREWWRGRPELAFERLPPSTVTFGP
jgi:hypothetical protein